MSGISAVTISINNPSVAPTQTVPPSKGIVQNGSEVASAVINLNDKYSQKEVGEILQRVGTDNKMGYPCHYSVMYYPASGTLALNNDNMTNDTTEILKDGSVRHCGSWHNKEVAPKGSFVDIVEDAQKRMSIAQSL